MKTPSARTIAVLSLPGSLIAGLFAPASARAQTDQTDQLQIVPPPVPRYRRERPAFVVKADPNSKPLDPTILIRRPVDGTFSLAPVDAPGRAGKELAKRLARKRERDREQALHDHIQQRLLTAGKVLGFVLIAGIGIGAVVDLSRMVRRAREAMAMEDAESAEADEA